MTGKQALFVQSVLATACAYENTMKFWSPNYLTDCTVREVIQVTNFLIVFSQLCDRHLRVSEKSDHHERLDNGHGGVATKQHP